MTPSLGAAHEEPTDGQTGTHRLPDQITITEEREVPRGDRLHLGKAIAVAMVACVLVGLAESVNDIVLRYIGGSPKSLSFVLIEQMPWWLLWTVFMPAVMWLARTYRFDDARWRRSAVAHAGLGLTIAILHGTLFGVFFQTVIGNNAAFHTIGASIQWFLLRYLFMDVMTYCAAVGIYYSFEYFSSFRHTALAGARSEARATRLELHLAQARLHALRMELNPHFLFNALNAVGGLVRRREHDKAIEILSRLGDLLRTTLDGDMPSEVPLADELGLLHRFLDIEQVRFGDRLRIVWEVDQDTRAALVPPLILQPLVENALRHGISQRAGAALLRISARRDGSQLELVVRDTGSGLSSAGGRTVREGIGLSNTRARLEQLYGRSAISVELADVADGGARARLLLPFHETRTPADRAIGATA
jgi:signal transduction histidine kinase